MLSVTDHGGTSFLHGSDIPAHRTIYPTPNQVDIGSMTAVKYGSSGFPAAGSPGPPARGLNFLAGGVDANTTSTQTIDLADVQAEIDGSQIDYDLSGWLGGLGNQNDRMQLSARFLNAAGAVLAIDAIGPVTAADRANVTSLAFRQATGGVPVGTRRIELELAATRVSGTDNDGYADNLSLVLIGS